MLHDGSYGKTLVSSEFNAECSVAGVEATINPFPNPGNPSEFLRQIKFRNLNIKEEVKVYQQDRRKQIHIIPPTGELTIAVPATEKLPRLEKVEHAEIPSKVQGNDSRKPPFGKLG
jgi:hypothetical protein